jgi:hypothetical protein
MAAKAPFRAVKLFGTEVPDAKRRELAAGPLTTMLDNGALRYIRYGGIEVLRGIAYLVRDKNWGTYAPVIENLKVKQGKDGFTVSYTATCSDAAQSIRYTAQIEGKADGTLRFSAEGLPLSDFLTNRTGFVVLHPLAGTVDQPVSVFHTDGSRERRKFPKFISPGQPFFEIRSLTHAPASGLSATVQMEGNKFEMEDQRNWLDASYKTYVCSLLDPWPYTLKKGEAVAQAVTVRVSGALPKPAGKKSSHIITVALGAAKNKLPVIGCGVPMAEAQAALAAADTIAAAELPELVCQIDGRQEGQKEAAAAFAALKAKTGAAVKLEIILPAKEAAEKEMASIAAAVKDGGLAPDSIVVTQIHDLKSFQPGTPRPWGPTYEEMAAAAQAAFPGLPIGGGMLSYFTELNRKQPPKGVFDFITHTSCPIVHAADDISVMETLETLPWTFASTRAIIGKSAYHIGPTSIAARDNPYGAAPAANPNNGRVALSNMDPRQRGLYAAAWTLGFAAEAARAGIDAVAFGAVTGPQGMIYRKTDFAQPWFDAAAAQVYPIYHVVAGLAGWSRAKRLDTAVSAPAKVAALALDRKGARVLWLANLTGEAQSVKVAGFDGRATVTRLDDKSFVAAARDPSYLTSHGEALKRVGTVELGPYAVVKIASA